MDRSRSPRGGHTDMERIKVAADQAFVYARRLEQGNVYSSQTVPGLSDADPEPFIVSFTMIDGTSWTISACSRAEAPVTYHMTYEGEASKHASIQWFLMQSTFKPLVYAMAIQKLGVEAVHRSVGSVGGFGYGVFEALPDGRAPNPLINAGALTLLEKLSRTCSEEEIAKFCCTLGDPSLIATQAGLGSGSSCWFDQAAVKATEEDSIRNRGLCCFLASRSSSPPAEPLPKNEKAVDTAVRLYCVADCLKTNTHQLSRIGAVFANGGIAIKEAQTKHEERLLSPEVVSMTLSQMLSAGMYEASGDWSRQVGIPAKSGVSGAIMCVVPKVCGIGIYSARIDHEGNSVRGMSFVRELVRLVPDLNMFRSM